MFLQGTYIGPYSIGPINVSINLSIYLYIHIYIYSCPCIQKKIIIRFIHKKKKCSILSHWHCCAELINMILNKSINILWHCLSVRSQDLCLGLITIYLVFIAFNENLLAQNHVCILFRYVIYIFQRNANFREYYAFVSNSAATAQFRCQRDNF